MVVHAIYGSKPHFKEFIQRYNWLWKHIVDFVGNLVHNFGNGTITKRPWSNLSF